MNKKKILITSTDVMMLQFLVKHVFYLKEQGFDVSVACSDVENHVEELREIFRDKVSFIVIECVRSPFSLKNLRGYKQMRQLINDGNYDVIWTNEPVVGVITRFAARKAKKGGTKILYFAHGFHFFKGASLKMWLIFYPVEKIMARYTDKLITINREDYFFAQKHFKRCSPELFNGIGVDTKKFARLNVDTLEKRKQLGVPADCKLYLSVAELEKRKNHDTVIRAFASAGVQNSYLLICGVGSQKEALEGVIDKLCMKDKVRLLGYRYDIRELLETADFFVLGSFQEGLSVAIMEAMAMGSLCIISKIRGNVDLIDEDNAIFFDPKDVASAKEALIRASNEIGAFEEAKKKNIEKIKAFDSAIILEEMSNTINKLVSMETL